MPSRAYRVTRAWRRRPGSASVLVAGLAAEAEQAVEQALGLLRSGVVGRPRLAVARFRAGQHFRDGVADDPHAHALGQLDLFLGVADEDRTSVVEGKSVSVRVDHECLRLINKTNNKLKQSNTTTN